MLLCMSNCMIAYAMYAYCKLYAKAEKALSNTFLQIARSLMAEKWNAEFHIRFTKLAKHHYLPKQLKNNSTDFAKASNINVSLVSKKDIPFSWKRGRWSNKLHSLALEGHSKNSGFTIHTRASFPLKCHQIKIKTNVPFC